MAKIPWHKYMFADHISDHVLFIIMTCSKTVLLQLCGFALDIFPSFSTLKTSWQGGKQMRKCFCAYTTSKVYFKKLRKGIQNIPGLGSKGERK